MCNLRRRIHGIKVPQQEIRHHIFSLTYPVSRIGSNYKIAWTVWAFAHSIVCSGSENKAALHEMLSFKYVDILIIPSDRKKNSAFHQDFSNAFSISMTILLIFTSSAKLIR